MRSGYSPVGFGLRPGGLSVHLTRDLVSEELELFEIIEVYAEVKGYPPYYPQRWPRG